ncbi:MAG TPA: hypothetical protein VN743_08365 [Blastocatellia bacterium]|nr:hypothetical protein [Blastocatellia bacterium]
MANPSTVSDEDDEQFRTSRGRIASHNIKPVIAVVVVAAGLSIASFVYFFANDMTNVYGDGVAHVNIARKVVDSPDDSLWQRYMQIGSPWLPLQTVLMLPLVANDWLWRTGAAGSFVSMLSFIIATLSLYLLAKSFYRKEDGRWRELLPLMSVAVFAINPSVLYLQSTPMSEVLFMAALVTSVYLLQHWVSGPSRRRLAIAALAMTVATLTRYEAWPVASLSIIIVALASIGDRKSRIKNVTLYASVIAIGPLYWLWHNWAIYGNALEFLTGPNSARGIYVQNRINFAWSKMFVGNAALDLLTMAAAVAVCVGPFVLLLSGAGFFRWLIAERRWLVTTSPAFLLIVTFLFHVWSIYRGEIQVFPLSAFGLLNVRYGLPHVLAVALFAPSAVLLFKTASRRRIYAGIFMIVAVQYVYLISEGPAQLAMYQEGLRNGVNARAGRERSMVASYIATHPPMGFVLMHTGALGPVVSQGDIRYSQVIHEGTERWHQIEGSIPDDVSTVIVQRGDPLADRISGNGALLSALSTEFEERLSVGNITVFERRESGN